MHLPIAFSPCPNDTFLFHSWVEGEVGQTFPVQPVLADIQHLNEWALDGRYPLVKVSIRTAAHVLDDYLVLPVGSALGHGCGPKIIANKPLSINDLADCRIAIPGKDTTAHLLLQLLLPEIRNTHFCTYEQVSRLLRDGVVDAGVIIHETRFTFSRDGFTEVADLGELWEQQHGLPLPLGGVVAKRSLGQETLNDITRAMQASLDQALSDPQAAQKYILEHSIEKDPEVVKSHIELYVNEETRHLSSQGRAAIETLFELGREKQLLPPFSGEWLFHWETSKQTTV